MLFSNPTAKTVKVVLWGLVRTDGEPWGPYAGSQDTEDSMVVCCRDGGSLSDKRLVFHRECDRELTVVAYNTSSVWEEVNRLGQRVSWSPGHEGSQWAASSGDQQPWMEIELWNRSSVTGIITKGTPHYYIESYTLMFSKDRKNWKVYKATSSKDKKVFEAHSDGHVTVLNSLIPSVVARYLLVKPQKWHIRASAQVQVLGCPSAPLRPRSHGDELNTGKAVVTETVPLDTLPTEGPVITRSSGPSQAVILVAGMVLGAALCVGCLLAGLIWWRRKRNAQIKKCCVDQGCQGFHGKKLPCTNPELVSYPLVRNIHDALPNPPHNAQTPRWKKRHTEDTSAQRPIIPQADPFPASNYGF
ncbi:discoidin, CUB and LCCL domain-containing protein 1-like [Sinocyclocheilus anshuiensis]|uniref:discoidin, CUB and LCCL domain-containing protein 1-like n=1 Tax=Sinocyclocheilus anshuiensis TaxID=1608454 RepID=UPI0007B967EE|nr:PREDICTED: discoidin, CUB and LCCL domain-containing protein 1-like [Sinocyclocheilus anshuiensis]